MGKSLVFTPCFTLDSIGNSLSNYLEARLCADVSGLHFLVPFLTMSKNFDPSNEINTFRRIASVVEHPSPSKGTAKLELQALCPCADACHEKPGALIHSHVNAAREILQPIFNAHYETMVNRRNFSSIVERQAWMLRLPPASGISNNSLPHVPDVSIHYRCGDNVVSHYGFLPFTAFEDLISPDAKTIYVMSESKYRKTNNYKNMRMIGKCTSILQALFEFLVFKFPDKVVLMLRGANVFSDLVRLAHAKQTFCSVSTFCFWPALVSSNWAYFPVTNLIAKGSNIKYRPHFVWLTKSSYFIYPGSRVRMEPTSHIINVLTGNLDHLNANFSKVKFGKSRAGV